MVRIAASFIAGVLLFVYCPQLVSPALATVSLVTLVLLFFAFRFLQFKDVNFLVGIAGLLAILLTGYLRTYLVTETNNANHLIYFKKNIRAYEAMISKLPEDKERSWKYEILIKKVYDGEAWNAVEAKTLLYVRKDSSDRLFFYGDKIIVKGSPAVLNEPANPYEFNFKRFLSFKNIYHQDFIKPNEVKWICDAQEKNTKYYSLKLREWASTRLEEALPEPQQNAVAKALTLGITDGIDNELQKAYSSSGAMHVLAVSGLHVGILYAIVLFLFRPFQNLAWSRWLVTVVSLLVLWGFAFVTGLSPSVLRAVTMFSFIAIARPFGRRTSIYNTLAASAFILLIYDPYLIMSVGFQLSYLAVVGIVVIHRPLYQLWEPQAGVVDWVWNISCVSIAAQLATFALGLLYFHQFPVYFLFSNLFVIPGAIVVLVLSLFVLATSFLPGLSALLGKVLAWMIQLVNYGVFGVENLPNSLIENIYITTGQCWLLILSLFSFILLVNSRKVLFMYVATFCVACFSILQWQQYVEEVNQKRIVVYDIPGHTCIEWIAEGRSFFISDSLLAFDEDRIRFHIRPIRLFAGVKDTKIEIIKSSDAMKIWKLDNMLVGWVAGPVNSFPPTIRLDYLVVSNNAFRSFEEIERTLKFDQLILDGTNTRYIADRIRSDNPALIHSVIHQGAYHRKL